jgi:glycolate oxidase iron-sulfur subunit
MRALLGFVLPRPNIFRLALRGAALARPLAPFLPARLAAMLKLAPQHLPAASRMDGAQKIFPAEGVRRRRVALLTGCAQRVVAPQINEATIRLLTRHGCEVVVPQNTGCCGALTHHMGQDSSAFASRNILAWTQEMESEGGLDAIVVNTSGCGTTLKDYGFMFRTSPELAEKAAKISALTRDISEFLAEISLLAPVIATGQRVAYHSACSLQHGQGVRAEPKRLLQQAGFEVAEIPDGHLCCGSAGTYNILQPEIATRLRDRKIETITRTGAQLVAAGNVGCITQISSGTDLPVVHTVELLDWATGGPKPASLARLGPAQVVVDDQTLV